MVARSVLVVLVIGAAPLSAGESWQQFRGPSNAGHSDSRGVALTWSESEHVTWKTPIPGKGWSSPVILGEQIWMTTATDEGHSLRAVCVERKTGSIVHDVEVFHPESPVRINATNSFASPSPIIEGDRLYVHYGTMGTACLDIATARVLWKNDDLQHDHGEGPGGSPALWEDLLLLNCDGMDVQYGVALDKRTGKVVWKTNRSGVIDKPEDRKKAFVTPVVIDAGDGPVAIMTGAEWVYAYDPRTGRELWNVKHPGFSVAPTPVFAHGLLYVSTGYMLPELFAIRPHGSGDITATGIAWKGTRNIPTKPSPLVVGDELYLVADGGVGTCYDAKTGKLHWRERFGGAFSASPLAVDGRIYCCAEDGRTIVFAPGTQYKELAVNKLDGHWMASPAVAGSALFLRSATHLYRIEDRAAQVSSTAGN